MRPAHGAIRAHARRGLVDPPGDPLGSIGPYEQQDPAAVRVRTRDMLEGGRGCRVAGRMLGFDIHWLQIGEPIEQFVVLAYLSHARGDFSRFKGGAPRKHPFTGFQCVIKSHGDLLTQQTLRANSCHTRKSSARLKK